MSLIVRNVRAEQTYAISRESPVAREESYHINARFINTSKYFTEAMQGIIRKIAAFIDSNILPRLGTRRAVSIFFT